MPLKEYFGGSGDKVMSKMRKEYGPEKAKRVFYATASKRGAKPRRSTGRTNRPR